MRRAVAGTVCAVVACVVLIVCHAFGESPGSRRVVKQPRESSVGITRVRTAANVAGPASHYDARAQASFVLRLTADRQAHVWVRAGGLQVEKTVAADGSFTAVLDADDDRLVVSMRLAGVDVSRGAAAVHLEFGQAEEADFLRLHRLLAGSKALRMHRTLASNLEPGTISTPGGAAVLLTDAFLGMLDGDVGALERLGASVARRAQVAVARVKREDMDSCYKWWENEVMEAFYQLVACKMEYSPWNPLKEVCNIRYIMRTEAAWFQFLGCCAVPIRAE